MTLLAGFFPPLYLLCVLLQETSFFSLPYRMNANDSHSSLGFYFIFFKFLYAVESLKEIRLQAVTNFPGMHEFYELIKMEGKVE
jgi:hypothetical protein